MEEALTAGARRRALAVMATPMPLKRALHKSPAGSNSGSTVTPDPKRHMNGSDVKTTSSSASSKVAAVEVPPVELFPTDAASTMDTVAVEDTQVDTPREGWAYLFKLVGLKYSTWQLGKCFKPDMLD